ncbi:MAG: hypothetical protein J5I92_17390 [Thiogranum sp.]|nr:hypothetical protein [Thiogranum sp.]
MHNAISPKDIESQPEPLSNYPSHWSSDAEKSDANRRLIESLCNNQYIQARRQGLYLAACIVDDVEALGESNPNAVIDMIRKRIAELVQVLE